MSSGENPNVSNEQLVSHMYTPNTDGSNRNNISNSSIESHVPILSSFPTLHSTIQNSNGNETSSIKRMKLMDPSQHLSINHNSIQSIPINMQMPGMNIMQHNNSMQSNVPLQTQTMDWQDMLRQSGPPPAILTQQQNRQVLKRPNPSTTIDSNTLVNLQETIPQSSMIPTSLHPSSMSLGPPLGNVSTSTLQQSMDTGQLNTNAVVPTTNLQQKQGELCSVSCSICSKEHGPFLSCRGGCGLHVHKECLGSEMLFTFEQGNICGNCYIMQMKRTIPEEFWGGVNTLSVRRALIWIHIETNKDEYFPILGHSACLKLQDIGRVAGYPMKPYAELCVEPFLQRWMRAHLTPFVQVGENIQVQIRDIITIVMGLYALQRACISHSWKERALTRMKESKYSVTDFLGWHPGVESPLVRCSDLCSLCSTRNPPELDVCGRCRSRLIFPTVFRKFSYALRVAFYSTQVGFPLGVSTLDVFSHASVVRAQYKGMRPIILDGYDWPVFIDQLHSIVTLLEIASDFGTKRLYSKHFEPELDIIFNRMYINQVLLSMEFELVGKLLQCMRLFGDLSTSNSLESTNKYDTNLIQQCEQFLIIKQNQFGSWCKPNGNLRDQYSSTVACSLGLTVPVFQGHGPCDVDYFRLLEKWSRRRIQSTMQGKMPPVTSKLLACGAEIEPSVRSIYKRLDKYYKRQLTGASSNNSLELLVTARLRELQKAKQETHSIKTTGATGQSNTSPHKIVANDATTDGESSSNWTASSDDISQTPENQDVSPELDQGQDDELTENDESLSLSGDFTIFDGLKFDDGEVIDLNQPQIGMEFQDGDEEIKNLTGDFDKQDEDNEKDQDDTALDDDMDEGDDDISNDSVIDDDEEEEPEPNTSESTT